MTTDDLTVATSDTPVGPLRVTFVAREPADVATFGGPPLVYDVASAREPAEFLVDGHPYGGSLRVGLDGAKVSGRLYRAGCFGRPASDVEVDVGRAVVEAMEPHAERVVAWGRQRTRDMIVAAVRRWDAVATRHRLEMSAAESNALLARQHLLEQCGEVLAPAEPA